MKILTSSGSEVPGLNVITNGKKKALKPVNHFSTQPPAYERITAQLQRQKERQQQVALQSSASAPKKATANEEKAAAVARAHERHHKAVAVHKERQRQVREEGNRDSEFEGLERRQAREEMEDDIMLEADSSAVKTKRIYRREETPVEQSQTRGRHGKRQGQAATRTESASSERSTRKQGHREKLELLARSKRTQALDLSETEPESDLDGWGSSKEKTQVS